MTLPSLNRFQLLLDASRLFASSLDFETTLENAAKMIVGSLADWCVIDLFGDHQDLSRLAVAHSDPTKKHLALRLKNFHLNSDFRNPYIESLKKTGKPIVVPEISDEQLADSAQSEERLKLLKEFQLKSRVNMPLVIRNRTLGILSLGWEKGKKQFTDQALPVIEDLSQRIAQSIDNAFLYHHACKAVQIREEFLSIASHELRTPLTSMQLRLQILQRLIRQGIDQKAIEGSIDNCLKQSNRMTNLIGMLLELTRLEHSQFVLKPEELNLSKLVFQVAERISLERGLDKSKLIVDVRCVKSVFWDPARIDQVLTNLISNAVKYGADNPIHLTVDYEEDINSVVIEVRDKGIGIPQDCQSSIFNRFERATNATQISGLGLGLYITRKIIKNHGGKISLKSKVGLGTVFTVELPLHCQSEQIPRKKLRKEMFGNAQTQKVFDQKPAFYN